MDNEALKPLTEQPSETATDESRRPSTQASEQAAKSDTNESQCCNGVCQVLWKPNRAA